MSWSAQELLSRGATSTVISGAADVIGRQPFVVDSPGTPPPVVVGSGEVAPSVTAVLLLIWWVSLWP